MIKTISLIIGLEYADTDKHLPITVNDISKAYEWSNSSGYVTHIFTDIVDVFDKFVSIIMSADDLLSQIKEFILEQKPERLVLYYSGHGQVMKNEHVLLLPDMSSLPFLDLRDIVLSCIGENTELFWIIDCCNPLGLHLPFKLDNNKFMISPTKIECILQPFLLITSCDAKEKSLAKHSGSLFTENLFHILTRMRASDIPLIDDTNLSVSIPTHKNRNLSKLVDDLTHYIRKATGFQQTVSIYSSYSIDPVLWLWIGSTTNYTVKTDQDGKIIIV